MKKLELTEKEKKILKEVYGESLNLKEIHIYHDSFLGHGSAKTIGTNIYLQKGFDLTKRDTIRFKSLLIHESVHVWQYKKIGWKYIFSSLYQQFKSFIKTGSRNGAYNYELIDGKQFLDYGCEQQAQMIEDYWLIDKYKIKNSARLHCLNFIEGDEFLNKYKKYLAEIKTL